MIYKISIKFIIPIKKKVLGKHDLHRFQLQGMILGKNNISPLQVRGLDCRSGSEFKLT